MSHNVFGGRERCYETPWTSAHDIGATHQVKLEAMDAGMPDGETQMEKEKVKTIWWTLMDSSWIHIDSHISVSTSFFLCIPRYWNVKESDVCLSFQRILLEVDFQKGFSASRLP